MTTKEKKLRVPLDPDHVVIRTLNMVIQTMVKEIHWNQTILKKRMAKYAKEPAYQASMVSYEAHARGVPHKHNDHDVHSLKDIARMATDIIELDDQIRKLTRRKLQLFGDIDFQGGDEVVKMING